MKKRNYYYLLLFPLLMACGSNTESKERSNNAVVKSEKKVAEETATPEETSAPEERHFPKATDHFEHMELNNGEKWKANPETTAGIERMNSRLAELPENMEGYQELVGQLHEDFGRILEECTMTGKAHEQLHLYLEPLMERIDRIDAPDLNVMKHGAKDLKDYLKYYDDYFE